MLSDQGVICPARESARQWPGNAYQYSFDLGYDGPGRTRNFAGHCTNVAFEFGTVTSDVVENQEISDLMSSYWTNFVKYGSPNPPSGSKVNATTTLRWDPYNEKSDKSMRFGRDVTSSGMATNPTERCNFWQAR